MLSKEELREKIRRQKLALKPEEMSAKSQAIRRHVKKYLEGTKFNSIHIYESLKILKEPETGLIIEYIKTIHPSVAIYVPRVNQTHKSLEITNSNVISFNEQIAPLKRNMRIGDKIDIFLLPLIAFDASGNRLGHGGGFYDKLLAHYPNAMKIGLAFEIQKVEAIPSEPHDVSLDMIITEAKAHTFQVLK